MSAEVEEGMQKDCPTYGSTLSLEGDQRADDGTHNAATPDTTGAES